MSDCCEEFSGVSRRSLLRGALGAAGMGAATAMFGSTFVQTAYAATRSAEHVIVLLSLRGAADGLSLVVPHGDPAYYAARPGISIPADQLIAADGFFGLHPALAPLLPLWNAGSIAAVHATGMATPNRSHFEAMEIVEEANPGSSTRVGWINRLIGRDTYTNPLQAVGMGMTVPITALYGPQPTVIAASVDSVALAGMDKWDPQGRRHTSMQTLWASAGGAAGRGARAALGAITDFAPVRRTPEAPANGAVYPGDDLGAALASTARTIKGDIGAEVIAVDHDGDWDMHIDLGTLTSGTMIKSADALARSLAAFFTDLGPLADKVTVVTLSEFGRRIQENGNYGVDHGYGNVMFLLGGGVRGGYYGTWPGLVNAPDQDLAVTTDYRSVLAEVIVKRLGASAGTVFPGFSPVPVGAML